MTPPGSHATSAAPARDGSEEDDHRPRLVDISPVPWDFTVPLRWAIVTVFGLIVVLFVWGFSSGTFTSLDKLQAWVQGFGLFGPMLYIGAQIAQVVVPVIPGGVGIIAGPLLFGFWLGSFLNYLASVIGSIIDFYVGRHLGLPAIRSVFPAKIVDRYVRWTKHPNFARLFAVAIFLPVAPDDLLCYLAGTTGMRPRWFIMIIVLGKPWAVLVYSWLVLNATGWLAGLLGWGS